MYQIRKFNCVLNEKDRYIVADQMSTVSDTNIMVTTGTDLETLISSGGSNITPDGGNNYVISGSQGTWILIKAVNIDPALDRIYTIYIK